MSKVFACLCTMLLVISGTAFAVGGEDISTATVIPALPYSDTGDTCAFLNDYDEVGVFTCPYSSTAADVVYAYTPAVDEMINIDLGASLYDTKVFVYENDATTVVGCDDDYYANYTSAIFDLAITGGNTYYIVVAGYGTSCGAYDLQVTGPPVNDACFTAVDSQGAAGIMSYTADIDGGFTMGDIDWDGFAVPINTGTYGSELTCDISGPLGTATVTLGAGTTYVGGAQFVGDTDVFAGLGDPAGTWTFDFYESYDDGGDDLPDATWDDICFVFNEVGCLGPDTCADALMIGSGSFTATTNNCTDAFTSYDIFSWSLAGNDHVYVVNAPCADTEICVTMTPLEGQDPGVAMALACTDGSVTAVAGADNGLSGDAESFCYVVPEGQEGDFYIFCDFYGTGSGGEYQLDVTITGPVANDTCENAEDVTGGGTFYGTTTCAANDYDGYCGTSWAAAAPDAAYVITLNDGDTLDVTMTPLEGQDPILYVVSDCSDTMTYCVVGADNGLGGDPEMISYTFECGGVYYIIADGWSTAEGDFQLDVVVTPGVPVDTFDVSMVCDPDPLTLPTQTKIRVYVTNTSDMMRQICGGVGVTLCNGTFINNVRAGSMVLASGETKFLGWGQNIPAYPATCDCTLVFETTATDCTPCELTGGVVAGWTETASCGITTVCPE